MEIGAKFSKDVLGDVVEGVVCDHLCRRIRLDQSFGTGLVQQPMLQSAPDGLYNEVHVGRPITFFGDCLCFCGGGNSVLFPAPIFMALCKEFPS